MRILFLLINITFIFSTEIIVEPYLQNASPNSIYIMWETSNNPESIIEWGTTISLGSVTVGTSDNVNGSSYIHTVFLDELTPDTRYYYRAITNDAISETFDFITPPLSSSEYPVHLIAMSDMQIDGSNPNKFYEIVNDGIIGYVSDYYSSDLSQELGMILIPGDLVENGNSYYQWEDHFFELGENIFSYVPTYPVFGNHEGNSDYYLKYFHLPDNGTPGYEEHWYYTDYSNLRVIGLDSNGGYQVQEQLDWLESVLEDACSNDHIDFVFAQLHHPYKSELWTPGESNYTGDVIERMENFTDDCGKPSIHFFGHTHGYSRGQSKDHNHLWVNVATAGGAIDYWEEWPQADYDEFTVTQDEWGFVSVDVQAGSFPQFTLTRISRGNENISRDNEIRDVITIKLFNNSPDIPIGTFPIGDGHNPDCIVLEASDFIDQDDDNHQSSHWQIGNDCSFSEIIYDRWRNSENWYNNINTQAEDDLTDEVSDVLLENSDYCWRVRYRDESLGWSEWSNPISFATSESSHSGNLLLNPGAELDIDGWTVIEGALESLYDGECYGISPHSGDKFFAVGGVCEDNGYGEVYQSIDLSMYSAEIDEGLAFIHFGGYLSNWGGSDKPEFFVQFLDILGNNISQTESYYTFNSAWTLFDETYSVPVNTREIHFYMLGTRYEGYDNDSYFDDMYLRYSLSEFPCEDDIILGDLNQDGIINIQDIIIVVNIILGNEPTPYQELAGDLNGDSNINILDIIMIVNIILGR